MAIGSILAVVIVGVMLSLLAEPLFRKKKCMNGICGREFFSFAARTEKVYAHGTRQQIYESRHCPHCNWRLSHLAFHSL